MRKFIFLTLFSVATLAFAQTADQIDEFEQVPVGYRDPVPFQAEVLIDHEDATLTVPQLIQKYGYPVEVHNVTTADGYILQLHRIPYSNKCGPSDGKKVALLQHGLLADSSNWIIYGPENSLAYHLADACYDVWMGNFRGNTYSKKHIKHHPIWNKAKFWAFSWQEMGEYDVPAQIDYILAATGTDGIYYTGHSMGSTAFFVAMVEHPEYNDKIKLMNAFAPVAFGRYMKSPIRLLAPIDGIIKTISTLMGLYEFLPSNKLMELFGLTVCRETSPIQEMCNNVLFLLAGYNYDQLDRNLMPILMGHIPAGTSQRTIMHFAQSTKINKFRKYSFNSLKNLAKYGSLNPPEYDLSKVTAPVALWWGENDWLASKKDVEKLSGLLPNRVLDHRMEHDKFNHFDFLLAKDMVELVNKPVMEFMKQY